MSTDEQAAQTGEAQTDAGENEGQTGGTYHVSDLPEGTEPDPLGNAKLSPRERAGHGGDNG